MINVEGDPKSHHYFEIEVNDGKINASSLNKAILVEIEKRLGLEFLAEAPLEGKVCFAQSTELRDEFKTFFTALDVLDYTNAVINSAVCRDSNDEFLKNKILHVPYPQDKEEFWQLVALYKGHRERD